MAEAMQVRRVLDEKGSHIEPPMQEGWSDLQKLQWWAAAASIDCGVQITVAQGTLALGGQRIPDVYDVTIGEGGFPYTSVSSFERCWYLINGIRFGVQAAAREGEWNFNA